MIKKIRQRVTQQQDDGGEYGIVGTSATEYEDNTTMIESTTDNDDDVEHHHENITPTDDDNNSDEVNISLLNNDNIDGIYVVGNSHNDTNIIESTSTTNRRLPRILNIILYQPFIPDQAVSLGNHPNLLMIENEFVMKLIKFIFVTYFGIAIWYCFVRYINWEHDNKLHLNDIWTYESTLIFNDSVVFFIVGRLYEKPGIDTVYSIFFILLANFYSSYITNFKMFQHSFTLYEMHCTWPISLFVFVLLIIPLFIIIILLHVYETIKLQKVLSKTIEMLLCLYFTLYPYIGSPYFHLHHWYAGWLVGMHLNYNTWWSRACMAWCWGCYINGIAVYGRDPVLTCGYALFISQDQRCPFIKCYDNAVNDPEHHTGINNQTQAPMVVPDWRNCSSTAYKP